LTEEILSLRDVKRKIIVMEMEPAGLAIRTYGDTAVSNAEFTITVRDSGQVKSRRTRLADVFVKRDGQWGNRRQEKERGSASGTPR
jgi:ketosteroid isomerase-like protein